MIKLQLTTQIYEKSLQKPSFQVPDNFDKIATNNLTCAILGVLVLRAKNPLVLAGKGGDRTKLPNTWYLCLFND
ncbi:MAG TPA: hypothetical protein DCR40_10985 [Prolixibacteraceae bacterium]|nr:hypothetical protein [Prolixibacteraceae bacterium]